MCIVNTMGKNPLISYNTCILTCKHVMTVNVIQSSALHLACIIFFKGKHPVVSETNLVQAGWSNVVNPLTLQMMVIYHRQVYTPGTWTLRTGSSDKIFMVYFLIIIDRKKCFQQKLNQQIFNAIIWLFSYFQILK